MLLHTYTPTETTTLLVDEGNRIGDSTKLRTPFPAVALMVAVGLVGTVKRGFIDCF